MAILAKNGFKKQVVKQASSLVVSWDQMQIHCNGDIPFLGILWCFFRVLTSHNDVVLLLLQTRHYASEHQDTPPATGNHRVTCIPDGVGALPTYKSLMTVTIMRQFMSSISKMTLCLWRVTHDSGGSRPLTTFDIA